MPPLLGVGAHTWNALEPEDAMFTIEERHDGIGYNGAFTYWAVKPFIASTTPPEDTRAIALVINSKFAPWERSFIHFFFTRIYSSYPAESLPDFHIFNGNDNFRTFQSEVGSHLCTHHDRYRLVIPVGIRSAYEVNFMQLMMEGNAIGQLFVGVEKVDGHDIFAHLDYRTDKLTTGVRRNAQNLAPLVHTLQKIKKDPIDNLIVFTRHAANPLTTGVELGESRFYQAFCAAGHSPRNVATLSFASHSIDTIVNTIKPGSTVCLDFTFKNLQYANTVIPLCKERNATLLTAELSSVMHGAALGSGNDAQAYAYAASDLLYEILVHEKRLKDLPIVSVSDSEQVCYNPATLEKQAAFLDTSELRNLDAHAIVQASSQAA